MRGQAFVHLVDGQADALLQPLGEGNGLQCGFRGRTVRVAGNTHDQRSRLPSLDKVEQRGPVRLALPATQGSHWPCAAGQRLPDRDAQAARAIIETQISPCRHQLIAAQACPVSDESRVKSTPSRRAAARQRSGPSRSKMMVGSGGPLNQAFCAISCSNWPVPQPA